MMQRSALFLIFSFALLGVISLLPAPIRADSVADIKAQIEEINRQRAAIDEEIKGYQRQLVTLGAQKQTLQGAIQTLDVSRNQTAAQIKDIQRKIAGANLRLSQLSIEIADKEDSMALDQAAVAASLRAIDSVDDASLIEQLLASDNLADVWLGIDNMTTLNQALNSHATALAEAKNALAEQHAAVADTKNELSASNVDLSNQKKALDVNRATKQQLLTQTQSTESQYQALIAAKRAEEAKFEAALFALASQLQAADTSKAPSASKGILAWPLSNITITQPFGRTADSGRLYTSGTHDGVDFAASVGTPVYAALAGTVQEINQGAVQNCQYGKWVLVRHANGLSTLYAHLSSINVSKGQAVNTGDTVGLAGMTGYATGPHLHLTVYNSSAVSFKQYTCKSGAVVAVPIAPPNGYLDPLAYLQ